MKHWWKILAALLVIYSIIIGLSIPLRTGIISDKSSMTLQSDQKETLKISFYNSRFKKDKPADIKARIRIDSNKAICASSVNVIDDRNLELVFDIPQIENLKSPFPFVEIGSPENGYVFSDVYIRKDSTKNGNSIENELCEAEFLAPLDKITFPFLNILEESIRNLFFHVPMWFGMMMLLLISVIYSIKQLRSPEGLKNDIIARSFANIGVLYGLLGVITGALWAKYTWGSYWSWDVKQNTSAIALMIYLAYFVLRGSFDDADKKARLSAVYNIFAFAVLIPLLYIIPRMMDSLHPGAEGNPAFSSYDLDSALRMVFYPAVLGWILLGVWMASLLVRIEKVWERKMENL